MSGFKSHTPKQIAEAIAAGKKIALLDSGISGHDDTLIAEPGQTLADIQAEVLDWYETALDGDGNPFEASTNAWSLRWADVSERLEIVRDEFEVEFEAVHYKDRPGQFYRSMNFPSEAIVVEE